MAFATVAELANALQVTIPAGAKTTQAQQALDHATALIQAVAERDFTEGTDTEETLDGNGLNTLLLANYPVTAVGSVEVNGEEIAVDEAFSWTSAGILTHLTGTWGTDRASIVVTYTHGYATIPTELKYVCLEVAKRLFDNPRGFDSKTSQDTAVSYPRTFGGLTDAEKDIIARIP